MLVNDLKLSSLVIDHSTKKIDHPYNVYDLIIFGGKPGVVIQVERDSLKVVNEQNEIIYVKISEITRRLAQKECKAQSWDKEHRVLTKMDVIKITEGKN